MGMENANPGDDIDEDRDENMQLGIFTVSKHLALRIQRHSSESYREEQTGEERFDLLVLFYT